MSRHLALDPREPPVQVTMPRQGQSSDGGSAETVAPHAVSAVGLAPVDQPLPRVRPAARHHSGVEVGPLRRPSRPPRIGSPRATRPRGMGLSKALLALLGSALVAALAGAWAYHSWSGNRALSHGGAGAAGKGRVFILDGVADTSSISFRPGRTEQVPVNVSNRNPQSVAVQGIEPGKVQLVDPVPPGCTAAMVKAVGERADLVIPPGGGEFMATVAMSKDAPSDCTGIAFSVTFTVTGSVTTA
jgi:hypothetical protein